MDTLSSPVSRPAALLAVALLAVALLARATPAQSSTGPAWFPVFPTTEPDGRSNHGMVYDAAREQIVVFGGSGFYTTHGDTWVYDGTTWTERFPTNAPSARREPAMTFDTGRARAVLFGGLNSPADTWEWDGTNWLAVATSGPPRGDHAIAYDAGRSRTVLFTGSETWEWDGTTWTQMSPAASPSVGDEGQMVYDATRRTILWFGSLASSGETWEYDGADWTQKSPATNPRGRTSAPMIYDADREVVVMFGGRLSSGDVGDTWEWDGSDWSLIPATVSSRGGSGMAYDRAAQRAVLFGGFGGSFVAIYYSDTWEYRLVAGARTGWSRRSAFAQGVAKPEMAYDTTRKRMVVFGGEVGGKGPVPIDTTWEGDARGWRRVSTPVRPTARVNHQLVYDAARARTLLFGGLDYYYTPLGGTWEWDGSVWTQRLLAVAPTPRGNYVMAYDSNRQRVVLFGGGNPWETWEWDGNAWTQRFPASSPPQMPWHGMAYDAARDRIVWFGGGARPPAPAVPAETWEWDGNEWRQRFPTNSPPLFYRLHIAYHAARQRTVVFGDGGTWEWDGNDWTQQLTTETPSPLESNSAIAYDAMRRTVVVVGGSSFTVPGEIDRVWEYSTIDPAAYESFGTGCVGTAGVLALQPAAGSLPWLGQRFDLELSPLLSPSPAAPIGILGSSRTSWGALALPVDLGVIQAPGCWLYTGAELTFPLIPQGTHAAGGCAIPNSAALVGLSIYAQGLLVGDPVNPARLVTSNAGELRLGAR